MENIINSLPARGQKRIDAILELRGDIKNAEVLFHLASTEKGDSKKTAQKALANLEYTQATDMWKNLIKTKTKGETILMPACSDIVSEVVASDLHSYFTRLFAEPKGKTFDETEMETLRHCVSIMLGKGTDSMQNIYRLAAENEEWISLLKDEEDAYRKEKGWEQCFLLNPNFIKTWAPIPEEMAKIFPLILSASIVASKDKRLMNLASELFDKYGGNWLIPVFLSALMTQSKEEVYENFSKYLSNADYAMLLYNVFGMLSIEGKNPYEKEDPTMKFGVYEAVIFWGSTHTQCVVVTCPVNFDERWLYDLAQNPNEEKPLVRFQCYNRGMGAVEFEAYDEMLVNIIPWCIDIKIKDAKTKQALIEYFKIRNKVCNGDYTTYKEATARLSD